MKSRLGLVLALAVCLLAALPSSTTAGIEPSSTVLVPYFEVDVSDGPCNRTTYFAVSNHSPNSHDVEFQLISNWGIPLLTFQLRLEANGVLTANLAEWLLLGRLPGLQLGQDEVDHLQAALSGRRSPLDNLYYGTVTNPDWAVGSLRMRVLDSGRPDVLWGDYFIYCTIDGVLQGETLVNLDLGVDEHLPCQSHGIRFLDNETLETELMFWSGLRGLPSMEPDPAGSRQLTIFMEIYDEQGDLLEVRQLKLLSAQRLPLEDLELPADFGWLQLSSADDFFVTAHVTRIGAQPVSLGLHSYCLPETVATPGLGIDLVKRINGSQVDSPPGLTVAVGAVLSWEYTVTNTGDVPLTGVRVEDDGLVVTCPKDTLEPGESMTCTAQSNAQACNHQNTAIAFGTAPDDTVVDDLDMAFYFGDPGSAIDVEKLVAGVDADTPPGPEVAVGEPVSFTYYATNTGATALTGVAVTDDQGLVVACPKATLQPGESMTCTAQATAAIGSHHNVATATGLDVCSRTVSDQDSAYYQGWQPSPGITIEKLTNGDDADTTPGPYLLAGSPVLWTYVVNNSGNATLSGVAVSDDKGVTVSCPKTVLVAGESMICSATGTAVSGQYANVGTATGMPPSGPAVTDSDPSHYFGQNPGIAIEKKVNGDDADLPPGPDLRVGSTVTWSYLVTNIGDVVLTAVAVTDDRVAVVTCPKTTLQPSESMTCTASGKAIAGTYQNIGTARGTPPFGPDVVATDPAHYRGVTPAISIEKLVNGEDADSPPGPEIPPGDPLLFTYVVTNVGDVVLNLVSVSDSAGLAVTCPKTTLQPAESMTCTATATAEPGLHSNIGTASGNPPGGSAVTAEDPCHYTGWQPGNQGCTPGYWKNHTGSWPPTGYSPTQSVTTVFAQASLYPSGNATLHAALAFGGGSGINGAAEILLRAAVAALLNAAHPGVAYPRTASEVVALVNLALASQNRDAMLSLAAQLDADNNLGCPLH